MRIEKIKQIVLLQPNRENIRYNEQPIQITMECGETVRKTVSIDYPKFFNDFYIKIGAEMKRYGHGDWNTIPDRVPDRNNPNRLFWPNFPEPNRKE